jgi:phosphoribosylaminoimidazolecarboxamide formyltransferase/IMP cyclohydrolase
MSKKRWALLSVANKQGIVEFAQHLTEVGFDLLATGKTAQLLQDAKLTVTEVSTLTGFPEILDGRVKTLHPVIHAGILARGEQDRALLESLKIDFIELVAVNLYPFKETIAKPNCTLAQAIEEIDIGGPTLLRAAAKNAARVTVVCDPNDYAAIANEFKNRNNTSEKVRRELAAKVFTHTAQYDAAISNYLTSQIENKSGAFPDNLTMQWHKVYSLRYGENPQQNAAFYAPQDSQFGLAEAVLLQGKELSFNNLADASAALECVKQFEADAACVIVKHGNPCGVALGSDIASAYDRAFAADTSSAFGGIIALNKCLDEELAAKILRNQFVEVIVAPEVSNQALAILKIKPALRVVVIPNWDKLSDDKLELRSVIGGVLLQERDNAEMDLSDLKCVTEKKPTESELADLHFAWNVVKMVKSNAIVCVKDKQTIGIGAGQTSRVSSVQIALEKAKAGGFTLQNSVIASDAFFPFADSIILLAQAGVTAIIQPGGSIRDEEVIRCANEHGISMVFTGVRHFRH